MNDIEIRFISQKEKIALEKLYMQLVLSEFHYPEKIKEFYASGKYKKE